MMSREMAHRIIDRAMEAVEAGGTVLFFFQGGEPTLAGLPFFQDFTGYAREKNAGKRLVQYTIQTNGYALTPQWADFFLAHQFLVGLSLDGTRENHDLYRVTGGGEGTFRKVRRQLFMLQDAGVACNLLCVVTGDAARHPRTLYRALQDLRVPFLQFIPCLETLESEGPHAPWSLTPELYAGFLRETFDLWYADWKACRYTSVRMFEDLVLMELGLTPSTCASSGACGSYLVLESDGSVYPCDFYCLDPFFLGKIQDMTIEQLLSSPGMQSFRKKNGLSLKDCMSCPHVKICHGGCRREWGMHGQQAYHPYCDALKSFFDHARPRLREIAEAERQARMKSGADR